MVDWVFKIKYLICLVSAEEPDDRGLQVRRAYPGSFVPVAGQGSRSFFFVFSRLRHLSATLWHWYLLLVHLDMYGVMGWLSG